MIDPKNHPEGFLAVLALIGAAIGLGRLLGSDDPITLRIAVGRAITSAGIGAAAGATTLLVPAADPIVMYGVAAALSSLGTSALETVIKRRLGDTQ